MNIIKLSGKVIFMNFSEKIALVKEHKELKGEYKVDEARVPVKVVGIGPKALKVLVFETSKFTCKPVWKQYWLRYKEDAEAPRFQLLIDEMVKTISS